jgi:hypothetical protein
MIHDFCGGLEEELMRTNFILVYELIDELVVMIFNISYNYHAGFRPSTDNALRYFEKICVN